jgi:uncharacterized protein
LRLCHARTLAVVAEEVEHVRSTWARMKGLLGRDSLAEGHALLIEPCSSIHTFFMRFPIDVLFLSRDLRVLRALHRLQPWRATRVHFGSAMAVELPAGTLERAQVQRGDRLVLL